MRFQLPAGAALGASRPRDKNRDPEPARGHLAAGSVLRENLIRQTEAGSGLARIVVIGAILRRRLIRQRFVAVLVARRLFPGIDVNTVHVDGRPSKIE